MRAPNPRRTAIKDPHAPRTQKPRHPRPNAVTAHKTHAGNALGQPRPPRKIREPGFLRPPALFYAQGRVPKKNGHTPEKREKTQHQPRKPEKPRPYPRAFPNKREKLGFSPVVGSLPGRFYPRSSIFCPLVKEGGPGEGLANTRFPNTTPPTARGLPSARALGLRRWASSVPWRFLPPLQITPRPLFVTQRGFRVRWMGLKAPSHWGQRVLRKTHRRFNSRNRLISKKAAKKQKAAPVNRKSSGTAAL